MEGGRNPDASCDHVGTPTVFKHFTAMVQKFDGNLYIWKWNVLYSFFSFSPSLKTTLQKKLSNDTVDLSGIPLSSRDVHRVLYYLQDNGDMLVSVDLSFTELQDENLRLLLPFLGSLPKLATLALNGNRLTLAIIKDLSEVMKDPKKFSTLAWIDLGNNVDIFTMPQPLLVALRRRCSLKSSLPTIYEYTEGQPYSYHMETSIEEASHYEEEEEEEEEEAEEEDKLELEPWGMSEKKVSRSFTLQYCERWSPQHAPSGLMSLEAPLCLSAFSYHLPQPCPDHPSLPSTRELRFPHRQAWVRGSSIPQSTGTL